MQIFLATDENGKKIAVLDGITLYDKIMFFHLKKKQQVIFELDEEKENGKDTDSN